MYLGYHVAREGDFAVSISRAIAHLDRTHAAVQIFLGSPRTYGVHITREEIAAIRAYTNAGLHVVVHGAYVDVPWSGNSRAIGNIIAEMMTAEEIGAIGVVIHLGRGALDRDNFRRIMHKIHRRLPRTISASLYLEIQAARSSEHTFERPDQIHRLYENILHSGYRIGICIDSAHLHSCGFTMTDYEPTEAWLGLLPDVPYILHLNDSKSDAGSGIDRHEGLRRGRIWSIRDGGLRALISWARTHATVILERVPELIDADLAIAAQIESDISAI